MKYVSRRYLREKWEKLKWDMEKVIDVYGEGPDDVSEDATRVAYELKGFMEAIMKELGFGHISVDIRASESDYDW